jgi:two-component system chemotaxis response regulator CheB
MPGLNIIAIGASAGGLEPLRNIVAGLPPDFPGALFVVLHLASGGGSVLPEILTRSGPLPASHPLDGERFRPGAIYVAPPDHHMVIEEDRVRLGKGARENRCRPAVDPLFRSAARYAGTRAIGIVLSGSLDDGTAGLAIIKACGGATIVQDPADALYAGMPSSAIEHVRVDHVLPGREIAPRLLELVRSNAAPAAAGVKPSRSDCPGVSSKEPALDPPGTTVLPPGSPSLYSCPECGGSLFQNAQAGLPSYRCRTGHAYSPESLVSEQAHNIESSLYAAMRALDENATLSRELAARAQKRGNESLAQRYAARAGEADHHAKALRELLNQAREVSDEDPSALPPQPPLS